MTLQERGSAALVRRMKLSAGRSITISRTNENPITVTGWVGNTLFARNQSDPGAAVIWGDRDYLIAVADYKLPTLTTPRIGDRIAETIDGVLTTFELMPPDTNEPAWRYSDQTRQIYRLHVKRVAGGTPVPVSQQLSWGDDPLVWTPT